MKTLIETRGEGGLIIVAPSAGGVHPGGKPYIVLQGTITTIATISPGERQALFMVARMFDKNPVKAARRTSPPSFPDSQSKWSDHHSACTGTRPGDRYNQRVTWEEVLEPHGWKLFWMHQGTGYWQHPEKTESGISATTNYNGSDLLYVFSTTTVFEPERGYSKFAAYAVLEHQCDYS